MVRTFSCPTRNGRLELDLHKDHVEVRLRKGKQQTVVQFRPAAVFEEIDNPLAGRLRKPDGPRYRDHFFLLCTDKGGQPFAQLDKRWETVERRLRSIAKRNACQGGGQ